MTTRETTWTFISDQQQQQQKNWFFNVSYSTNIPWLFLPAGYVIPHPARSLKDPTNTTCTEKISTFSPLAR